MNSKKVIITGNFGVGKTSLFSRFVHNVFSERYLTTIGVKVDKKEVMIDEERLTMVLWDIAGEVNQEKVPKAYFLGSSAVIYVFDLTRAQTYENMAEDLQYLNEVLPGVIIATVGNKKDLVTEEELERIQALTDADFMTSAKTGEYVEELFMDVGRQIL